MQQGPIQQEFNKQTTGLASILANPLVSSDQLKADYEAVIQDLAPISSSRAIEMLVSLAEESGINTDKENVKLKVPPASISTATLGGNTYRLLSFSNISVQGDYDSVLAFISALDSDTFLKTLVLTKVITTEIEVAITGEEETRRKEFREVVSAVAEMMEDNDLAIIPNPINFSRGTATSYMGDNPNTSSTIEGFPDISTSVAAKGYGGTGAPKNGYVLFEHDKISLEDITQYESINYYSSLTTEYYYTCEVNGTIRQWDGPNVTTAIEFFDGQNSSIELSAILDVKIYSTPLIEPE
ncbi:hypothetical protein ACFLWR_02820 [Chloroflexota bacterium]